MIIKIKVRVSTFGKNIPVCRLDTDSLTVTIFNTDTLSEEHYTFHSDSIRYHVHYVVAKYKERFQRYVDNGTIHKYLSNLETRVIEIENRWLSVGRKVTKNVSLLFSVVTNGKLMG